MIVTWLTERFGLEVPVVGAPMAGPGGGRLAAAVSAAGALGMFGVGADRTPDWVAEQARVAAEPGRPFGVGLLAWALPANPGQLDAVIESGPALVSVSFGELTPYVRAVQDAGIAVTTQVGNLEEARTAEVLGVDFVVVRGAEGGGHGRNEVATLPLLQTVLEEVRLPVVSAGGVATARGLAAVLAAGAVGAWVGTAFLGCPEASSSATARRRLFAAGDTGTAYGRVFDVGLRLDWPPEYGGRALRNSYFDTWADRIDELAADDAAAAELAHARREEDYDTAGLYAGEGVGLLRQERPAAEVVADLAGAEQLLRRFC